MIMTMEDQDFLLRKRKDKELRFTITNKCNQFCAHCSMNASINENNLLNNEKIDEVFNQITSEWMISIFGGEPMLFPDTVLYISNKCKEKNLDLIIHSNCFWGKDKKMLEFVKNEVKPKILLFSLDSFHSIDYKIFINLIKFFRNIKDIYICVNSLQDYPHKKVNKFKKYNMIFFENYLFNIGRSNESTVKYIYPQYIVCTKSGLDIHPNGDIYILCGNHYGCNLGNIKIKNIEGIYEKYKNRNPKILIKEPIVSQYDICKDEILNSRWDVNI